MGVAREERSGELEGFLNAASLDIDQKEVRERQENKYDGTTDLEDRFPLRPEIDGERVLRRRRARGDGTEVLDPDGLFRLIDRRLSDSARRNKGEERKTKVAYVLDDLPVVVEKVGTSNGDSQSAVSVEELWIKTKRGRRQTYGKVRLVSRREKLDGGR
jgi:hypothetical protein